MEGRNEGIVKVDMDDVRVFGLGGCVYDGVEEIGIVGEMLESPHPFLEGEIGKVMLQDWEPSFVRDISFENNQGEIIEQHTRHRCA